MAGQTTAFGTDERRPIMRAVLGAAVGNFVEWFDFALYGLLATILAKQFFVDSDGTTALLSIFAVFGVAFVIRPFGALFFGSLGDRLGRKRSLVIVITTMSLSTFLIGVIPTAHAIGSWATVMLVLLRLLQGFSAGGELGGANTFLMEYAEPDKRATRVGMTAATSLVAIGSASLLVFVLETSLSEAAMTAWGWRVPFLVAGPLGIVGLFIRNQLEDTPTFQKLEEQGGVAHSPLRKTFSEHKVRLLQTFGMIAMISTGVYTTTAYLPSYYIRVVEVPASTAALATVLSMGVGAAVTLVVARISDVVGRRPVLIAGCVAFAVLAYPVYTLLQPGQVWTVMVVAIIMGTLVAIFMAPCNVLMVELFSADVRYSGSSIGYNIGTAVFGGACPYLATALVAWTGSATSPALLVILAAIITLATILTIPETGGRKVSRAAADSSGIDIVEEASVSVSA